MPCDGYVLYFAVLPEVGATIDSFFQLATSVVQLIVEIKCRGEVGTRKNSTESIKTSDLSFRAKKVS